LGLGDWGLATRPHPQSPTPNPQSPIPNPQIKKRLIKYLLINFIRRINKKSNLKLKINILINY